MNDPAPSPAAEPSTPSPRRFRWGRWLLGSILALLGVFLVVVGWVFVTESGLRAALTLAEHLAPGQIAVARVSGRLRDEARFDEVRWHGSGFDLRLGELRWHWQPVRLLSGTLHLVALEVRDPHLILAPAPETAAPPRLPSLRLPLNVELARFWVERPRWGGTLAEPPPPLLERAELAARLSGDRLEVRRLTVQHAALELEARGELRASDRYPLALTLDWRARHGPALAGRGAIDGELAGALRLTHTTAGPLESTLEATLRDVLADLRWDAVARVARADLPALLADAPALDLAAELQAHGTTASATLTGTLSGTPTADALPELPPDGLRAALALGWQNDTLTIDTLRLTEATSGAALDLAGRLEFGAADGTFALRGDWQGLRWPLTGVARWAAPAGRLEVTGHRDDFAYRLMAELTGTELPAARLALQGAGSLAATRLDEARLETLGGQLTAKGTLRWAPTWAWDVALTAAGIDPGRHWPALAGQLALKAETKGNWEQGYEYQLKAETALAGYPGAVLHLAGTGTPTAARFTTVALETLGGRCDGTARIAWAPFLDWDAHLTLVDLDPGKFLPDWPGRLSGRLTSAGRWPSDGLTLEATLTAFGGQLRGYPVTLDAALARTAAHWEVRALHAVSGRAQLNASGRIGDTWALDFALAAPDLGELLPQTVGQLDLSGQLSGTSAAPSIALRATGRGLRHATFGLGQMDAEMALGAAPDAPLRARIAGRDLAFADTGFETVTATADGQNGAHRARFALAAPTRALQLEWQGQWQPPGKTSVRPGAYRGELRAVQLSDPTFGAWKLRRATPFAVASDGGTFQLGPLCLDAGDAARGCVELTRAQPEALEARLQIERLALDLLAPLLPTTVRPSGMAHADATFTQRGNTLAGRARIDIPRGELQLALPGVDERLNYSGAQFEARGDAAGLTARLALPLAELGQVEARLGMPDWTFALSAAQWPRQRLRGNVNLALDDLGRVARWWPMLAEAGGRVEAAFELGGTLGAPAPRGQAQVRDLRFKLPDLGLALSEGRIDAQARGTAPIEVTGSARLGKGTLRLAGAGRQESAGWHFDYRLDGQRLKVAATREYAALLDANLTGSLGAKGLSLTGQLALPEARIAPRELPEGAVTPSPDVRLAGTAAPEPPLPMRLDVALRLGDAVRVEAFGLRGRLRGTLRALQEPGKPLLGDGQLEVVDGTYRLSSQLGVIAAVGRPLTIEQGLLVFAKTPLDNPGLVLSVQRQGGDMAAGVRVLGTLKQPKLTFFSESDPNLTQGEITQYLLTGVPPRRGLEESDRALSVGTYIAPKLFLEYETDLSDQSDRVKLRYDLSERIEVQTQTGKNQGADIFFKFEN